MKLGTFALTILGVLAPFASAQPVPPAPQTIYGNVTGLNCQGAGNSAFPGFAVFVFDFGDAVVQRAGASGASGQAATGRPTFPNIRISKGLDDCTPLLFGAVAKGTTFRTATLTVTTGNPAVTLLLVTLQDVQFTSESFTEDGADGNPRDLDEVVTLSYSRITITHVSSGKSFSWDVQRNAPF